MTIKDNLKNIIKYFIYTPQTCIHESDIIGTENGFQYLAICAIIKNEAPYLKEWIEYHLIQGVNIFYIYDNDSSDNSYDVLKPYIEKNLCIYHKIHGKKKQLEAYNDAIIRYRKSTYWIAFIDADEFIFPKKEILSTFLRDYEKYSSLSINWCMFDSNKIEKPDGRLVIEAYTSSHKNKCFDNNHVKNICKPKRVKYYVNAHYPLLKLFRRQITADYKKFRGPYSKEIFTDTIQINHYFCKSRTEYIKKIKKPMADNGNIRGFEEFRLNFDDAIQNTEILKYADTLKQHMKD